MARFAILMAMTLLLAVGALFMLREWDLNHRFYRADLWTKVHFQLHRQAFESLGKKFESDPVIYTVSYIPPRWRLGPIPKSFDHLPPEDRKKALEEMARLDEQVARYEPFIESLKYPGGIYFYTTKGEYAREPRARPEPFEGPTELDLFHGPVYISDSGNRTEGALFMRIEGEQLVTPCPDNPRSYQFMDCLNPLGGNWWMRYQWIYAPLPDEAEPSAD